MSNFLEVLRTELTHTDRQIKTLQKRILEDRGQGDVLTAYELELRKLQTLRPGLLNAIRAYEAAASLSSGEIRFTVLAKSRAPYAGNPTMVVELEGVGRVELLRQGGLVIWAFRQRPDVEKKLGREWLRAFDRAMDRAWEES